MEVPPKQKKKTKKKTGNKATQAQAVHICVCTQNNSKQGEMSVHGSIVRLAKNVEASQCPLNRQLRCGRHLAWNITQRILEDILSSEMSVTKRSKWNDSMYMRDSEW